jgi:hypothetical protein
MKTPSLVLAIITALVAVAAQAQSQPARSGSCDDVQWRDARLAKSCTAVIERNGKRYVQMSGKVARRNKDTITVLLDNSKEELTWMPDLGETVLIDGKQTPPANLVVGQHLRFYVPIAQVTTK